MSKKKLIPVFNIRQIAAHTDLIPVQEERYNFTLDITLSFSFDGTEAEAKEKIDEDIKSFEREITEGLSGTGLDYAVNHRGKIYREDVGYIGSSDEILPIGFTFNRYERLNEDHKMNILDQYNFTLEVSLYFSFDGTEAEAKEKLNQDKKDFEKIITEGMTGSGLEYAVVAGHIFKHHAVD